MKFFDKMLLEANNLSKNGFKEWIFLKGMGFNSLEKWWGDKGRRSTPHEGVDFCFYKSNDNSEVCLDEKIKIPVLLDGEVKSIVNDFLGKSVFIQHQIVDNNSRSLFSIYGHTKVISHVNKGTKLTQGQIFANISKPEKKTRVPIHLHLSLAWIASNISPDNLNWDFIGKSKEIEFVDSVINIAEICT